MTGAMLSGIEEVLIAERPNWILVYGDTNSTLAGALAAAKLDIPVAHVEAGLRSFNKKMPEEINRILTDHVSRILFAPTVTAVSNLSAEGITDGVIKSGDVMLDAYLVHKAAAASKSDILTALNIDGGCYFLATVHRQENTDNGERLISIFRALDAIGRNNHKVILPLHPRTRKVVADKRIDLNGLPGVQAIEPVSYLDMIQLEVNSSLIFTDSGGVQKEAYFAGVPCVTLRDETEWVETIDAGVNFLAGASTDAIVEAYERALNVDVRLVDGLYGDGDAAQKVVESLLCAY
jgi:UDP-N-acetylglucosamine 2-epimerase